MNRKKKAETPVKKTAMSRGVWLFLIMCHSGVLTGFFFSCYLVVSALGNVIKSVNFLILEVTFKNLAHFRSCFTS